MKVSRGGNWSLLSFQEWQLSANLLGVPQILRLAGLCVAAVGRSSLGLLQMQLAAIHSLLHPDEEILKAGSPRWGVGVERSP